MSRRCRAKDGAWGLIVGVVRDLGDISAWIDTIRVLAYGVLGVVWAKIWGGENFGCGWFVNAACMSVRDGTLANKPQVVVL